MPNVYAQPYIAGVFGVLMDISVSTEKKSQPNIKRYGLIAVGLVSLFFIAQYLWQLGQSEFQIDRDSLVIDEVKRGRYTVSVRGTGLLVPDNIQYLSAEVEATVERLVLKAGNVVQKGDLIVELSNPQLLQRLEETKWELKALEEEFKASQVDQASSIQQQESRVLNAVLDEERAQLEFDAHEELIATGAVSKLEYERRRVALQQSKQRLAVIKKRLSKMKENLEAQKQARIARLNQTRKALERIQQQVDGLQVRASMDAIVLEVPLEPGQRIKMGANIAKLAEQDSLIAELQVPEIQIRDVSIGQKVMIDTRNSKIEGVVARVDPAVVRGNVQVDVHFQGDLPSDARPDLSVDGEIKITEISDALYVGRPLFAQSQSNISLYKLAPDESIAERVEVKVGYGSVNQIQIVSGLTAGDKIITSDPTRFETYDKFRVN